MEQSPLTLQARPEVFEPKVVQLYKRLFKEVEEDDKPQGFWKELFLLKPDTARLRQVLDDTDADFLLHNQHQPQQLVVEATASIKSDQSPSDENALNTLAVFFAVVLSKKYTNPSSDIIEVLAGLNEVDAMFSELVAVLDHCIKDGRTVELRQKAVKTAIALVAGGYQTALVSYFIQRDLFPALMKLVHQLENPLQAAEPLLLAGLLANYNKFEAHNQYRVRFADFVNDSTMQKVVESASWTCTLLRQRYIGIQDDTPTAWSVAGTLSYVGLGSIAGAKPAAPVLTEDQQRELFAEQPGTETASILTLYDFALSNKLFCHHLVSHPSSDKGLAPPFSNFLSFTSYLYQHAYRSSRASLYAYLTLLIMLVLVEDTTSAKSLCETSATVRLCRQRPPLLPLSKVGGERPYICSIVDILVDGVNHNLRKRLDTAFYRQSLTVLHRTLSYVAKSRSKLAYHWAELWRSLLSFARFLTTYGDDLKSQSGTNEIVEQVVELLHLALTAGESFMPDGAAYDDLVYKLVESGDALVKLRDVYGLARPDDKSLPISSLIHVSRHYGDLIASHQKNKDFMSPREVGKIIKDGYDTLSLEARDGIDQAAKYREADHKVMLKKIARVAVADASTMASVGGSF